MTSRVGILAAAFVGLALTVFFFSNESRHTAALETARAEVAALRKELELQSTTVTDTSRSLRGVTSQLLELESHNSAIHKELASTGEDVKGVVTTRVSTLEQRLGQAEATLSNLDTIVAAAVDNAAKKADAKVSGLLDTLELKLDSKASTTALQEIQQTARTTSTDFAALHTLVTALQTEVEVLTARLAKGEQTIAILQSTVSTLSAAAPAPAPAPAFVPVSAPATAPLTQPVTPSTSGTHFTPSTAAPAAPTAPTADAPRSYNADPLSTASSVHPATQSRGTSVVEEDSLTAPMQTHNRQPIGTTTAATAGVGHADDAAAEAAAGTSTRPRGRGIETDTDPQHEGEGEGEADNTFDAEATEAVNRRRGAVADDAETDADTPAPAVSQQTGRHRQAEEELLNTGVDAF